jgi:hypothetical protein
MVSSGMLGRVTQQYVSMSSLAIVENYVRFKVFRAVTEEWCLLECYAVWIRRNIQEDAILHSLY